MLRIILILGSLWLWPTNVCHKPFLVAHPCHCLGRLNNAKDLKLTNWFDFSFNWLATLSWVSLSSSTILPPEEIVQSLENFYFLWVGRGQGAREDAGGVIKSPPRGHSSTGWSSCPSLASLFFFTALRQFPDDEGIVSWRSNFLERHPDPYFKSKSERKCLKGIRLYCWVLFPLYDSLGNGEEDIPITVMRKISFYFTDIWHAQTPFLLPCFYDTPCLACDSSWRHS